MQIKKLENKDIRFFENILKEYIKQLMKPYTKKEINREVNRIYTNMCVFTEDKTAMIIGALDENNLIGFIWGYRKKENNDIIHINYFFINENYRNKGIGRLLLKELEKNIENFKEIELLVNKNNLGALRFYKRNGFEIKEEEIEDFKLYKSGSIQVKK